MKYAEIRSRSDSPVDPLSVFAVERQGCCELAILTGRCRSYGPDPRVSTNRNLSREVNYFAPAVVHFVTDNTRNRR